MFSNVLSTKKKKKLTKKKKLVLKYTTRIFLDKQPGKKRV